MQGVECRDGVWSRHLGGAEAVGAADVRRGVNGRRAPRVGKGVFAHAGSLHEHICCLPPCHAAMPRRERGGMRGDATGVAVGVLL